MIIFLNGPINAGKSTIAKLLVEELPDTALLEIDTLRKMIDWMPIDQAVPINLENAVLLIRNFAKRGVDLIVPYPLSQKDHDYMLDQLKDVNTKIFTFTLAPKLEKALTNRGTRELNDWEKSRIKHHYEIGINNPSFGEVIDNSDISAEEVKNYILSRIWKD